VRAWRRSPWAERTRGAAGEPDSLDGPVTLDVSNAWRYYSQMIRSFRTPDTERLFQREPVRRWSADLPRAALRKLVVLDAAESLDDLRVPPGKRLQELSGDRAGQPSIRVNDQWRVWFRWRDGDALDVEITDDHEEPVMTAQKLAPVHPGEVLLEEFLKPLELSQYRLAKALSVPPRRINEIVHGKRAVSANTALRLARYFQTTDRFWLNLQARFDLEVERDRLGTRLEREVAVLAS
jgi:addiction module HigA family antidote